MYLYAARSHAICRAISVSRRWKGIRLHRGKGLAAFLKAIGYIIPLMDAEYANYYTREVMIILLREFASPDEEMKKIVLKGELPLIATRSSPGWSSLFDVWFSLDRSLMHPPFIHRSPSIILLPQW